MRAWGIEPQDDSLVLGLNSLFIQPTPCSYLISSVPDEALPVAGDGYKLVGLVGDVLVPQELTL